MNVPVRRRVAVVFPGQGAQQARMGAGLYGVEPVFTKAMDEFFLASGDDGPLLREDWLAAEPGPLFDDCSRAQPLLFAVGYALGVAVAARGVPITTLVGHSVGELAAAAIAGVFSIQDGATVLAARTRAMAATEPGGMLAVAAGFDRVREVLGADMAARGIAVAAINSPRQTVLAGTDDALTRARTGLSANQIGWHPAKARQAFHSPLCAGAATEFSEVFRQISLRAPTTPILSTYTGRDVTDEEAVTPDFWSTQLARPVLFWAAVDDLLSSGHYLLLEAGPGGSCAALLRRHHAIRSGSSIVLPLLPAGPEKEASRSFDKAISDAVSLTEVPVGC